MLQKLKFGLTALALTFGVSAAPTFAQQTGLVNVDLSGIAIQIADDIDVDVSQIPVTVQVPVGVAANVCNVAANVLAADINQAGGAECRAENTSTALNQIVQRRIGG